MFVLFLCDVSGVELAGAARLMQASVRHRNPLSTEEVNTDAHVRVSEMHLIRLLLAIIVSARSEYFHLRHPSERWSDFPGYYDSRDLLPDPFKKSVSTDEYRQEASFVHGIPREYELYNIGRSNQRNYSAISITGKNLRTSHLHEITRPRWVLDTLQSSNANLTKTTHTKWNEDTVDLGVIKHHAKNASEFLNSNIENARNISMMASSRILNGLPNDSLQDSTNDEPFRFRFTHLEETAPKAEEELRNSWRRRKLRGAVIKELMRHKVAKFLNLFTIIKFPNTPCHTAEGINGTCYHHLECKSLGGVPSGPCAHGYGVCCYFERTCGDTVRQNCTYFVNPGYPHPSAGMLSCILTIEKANPHVSQIRLDFFDFDLQSPDNGTCVEDQFIVTGQNTNSIVPIICGYNTGQHIYVDVDNTRGPVRLNVLGMSGNFPRKFRIKVTQLKPDSPLKAPKNCLQYYTRIMGTFESFNYSPGTAGKPGYLNNLNYAICIKKEPGYCTITYTNAGPFQLVNVDEDGVSLTPEGQAGAELFNCPDDYIVIGGIRLCGERLNDATVEIDFTKDAPVTDTGNGPFIIPVRTNKNITGRGFRLNYKQNKCASSRNYRHLITGKTSHPPS